LARSFRDPLVGGGARRLRALDGFVARFTSPFVELSAALTVYAK
jgi:hypothetical protein